MTQKLKLTATVLENQFGQRLDQALTKIFPKYSRSQIKEWILNQCVLVNGTIWDKPKKKVLGKENITINVSIKEEMYFKPQNIPLNIIYEDDDIIVINKQRNLVIHPGAGNPDGTMLNALLHYYPPIISVPRAGIVHRLDKDTTGLMVIAKTALASTCLMKSLQRREIIREYEAVVVGRIYSGGTIKQPIKRHPIRRAYMSVHPMGKHAVTHFRVIEHFRVHTRLRLLLETGRTHQIRVHMLHITHPIVGDQIYGSSFHLPKTTSKKLITVLHKFDRQALHAITLRFHHPISNVEKNWYAPIPQDMTELINAMRADFENHEDKTK